MMLLLSTALLVFSACSETDDSISTDGNAKIENLAITPASGFKYGDVVTLTGTLSDETMLSSYTIKIGDYEEQQPLTGKTFPLNKEVVLPLSPNAETGNLTLSLSVRNSGGKTTEETLLISNIAVPVFDKLYLAVGSSLIEMVKDGDVFTFAGFVPAGAKGKIYANADKSGLYWGWEDGKIKTMVAGDIPLSQENEEFYFTLSFNVKTFDWESSEPETWAPMDTDVLFIFGTISGHWEDNAGWDPYNRPDGIDTEMNKMKMKGYINGNQKRWTWEPPDSGGDDREETCYGSTSAGVFRFKYKKDGVDQYVTYSGKIDVGADNIANSFQLPAGGSFKIEVMADETGITSVRTYDDGQGLQIEYKNNEVWINGAIAPPVINFAGNAMNLVPGNYFVYQGSFDLSNGQEVTGDGIDLAKLYADSDIFGGGGNSKWSFTGPTSTYFFRIDAFSGHVYSREDTGYPTVIYMDGWCWKKYPEDPRSNWNTRTEMSLYRDGTTNVYEGTCYVQPWNGDIKFFAMPSTDSNEVPGGVISGAYFDLAAGQAVMTDGIGLMLPVPSGDGAYYKVSVNLKDGMELNEDGAYVPVGANFTYSFTLQP